MTGKPGTDLAAAVAMFTHPTHPDFPEAPSPDSANAAARYLALSRDVEPELAREVGWVDTDAVGLAAHENEEGITGATIAAALERNEAWIDALVEATRLERCDWHLSDDFRAIHRGENDPRRWMGRGGRRASEVLRADARRLWALQSPADRNKALGRVAATVRLSGHYRGTANSLMSMIADRMLSDALDLAALLLKDARDAERAELMETLAKLDVDDPGGSRADWKRRRSAAAAFSESQLAGGRIGVLLAYDLAQLKGIDAMVDEMFGKLLDGDAEGIFTLDDDGRRRIVDRVWKEMPELEHGRLVELLARARALGDRIDREWDSPAIAETIEEVESAIEADATGLLGYILGHPRLTHRAWRERLQQFGTVRALPAPDPR